jgi:DNA recombination protein RmuC
MEIYILPAAAIIIVVLFILLRAKPKSGIADPEEFDRLKSENEQLKISLAKAEERAENLRTEQEYLKKESKCRA